MLSGSDGSSSPRGVRRRTARWPVAAAGLGWLLMVPAAIAVAATDLRPSATAPFVQRAAETPSERAAAALSRTAEAGKRARALERARDLDGAIVAYRTIVDDLDALVARGGAALPPAEAFAVWWTLASARLDLARVSALALAADPSASRTDYDEYLARARAALDEARAADAAEAEAAGRLVNPQTWKIHSAYAWLAVLQGDREAALEASDRAERLRERNPWQPLLSRAQSELESSATAMPLTRTWRATVPVPAQVIEELPEVSTFLEAASPAFAPGEPPPRIAGADALRGNCPVAFTGTCYPVWFGTNRRPVDPAHPERGFGGEPDDHVHYGKRVVLIPRAHRPGELSSPFWRRIADGDGARIALGPQTTMSEDAFTAEIRRVLAELDPSDRDVLVFVHGYNVSFEKAARRAAQLGFDLRVPGVTAFFSWPSRGRAGDYFTDAERIEASEAQIGDFLIGMARLAGRGRVHVIAHSMGNRGLLGAMHRATTRAALETGVHFGTIMLAAPDVDVKTFRDLASVYPLAADRTTLYVGDSDKALAAIEWFSRDPRAGSAPPPLVVPGIDTVLVRGSSLFRLGHSYVAEDLAVVRDIATQVHLREGPAQRRARNGWPVPDTAPDAVGAWVIGR